MTYPTRFGAKPSHPDTFYNYQPLSNTAGFISEANRLVAKKDLNSILDFQREDKQRRDTIQKSKFDIMKQNQDNLNALK